MKNSLSFNYETAFYLSSVLTPRNVDNRGRPGARYGQPSLYAKG